jgi:NAD+ diphosphatase
MPDFEKSRGVYVFQGASLVLPVDAPDRIIPKGLSPKDVTAAFGGFSCFEVPHVEGGEGIPYGEIAEDVSLPADWQAIPLRSVLGLFPDHQKESPGTPGPLKRLLRAYHTMQWRRESAFCGSCGSRNADAVGEFARLCPVCGRLEYPRISPAVIVLILDDEDRLLLAHNKKFSSGIYSLIAGFNEAGENLEDTVVREIREEVGLEVRDICYVASQPWPFPNSLMIGFKTRCAGGSVRPDGEEIIDARWFSRDKLPGIPSKGSLSRYLIDLWLSGQVQHRDPFPYHR